MKPKISVLVPAYNVALWLPSCLDSILAQTYQNLEIIVVNDGSTDNTGTILDSYAKKNGRIVAIHQKNAGLVVLEGGQNLVALEMIIDRIQRHIDNESENN